MAFMGKPLWRKGSPKGLFNFFVLNSTFFLLLLIPQIQPQRREASANVQWPGFFKELNEKL
jgi:hypothetical protein